jgi:hypothetical protein
LLVKKIQSYDIFDHFVASVDMQTETLADVLEATPFLACRKLLNRFFGNFQNLYVASARILLIFFSIYPHYNTTTITEEESKKYLLNYPFTSSGL